MLTHKRAYVLLKIEEDIYDILCVSSGSMSASMLYPDSESIQNV